MALKGYLQQQQFQQTMGVMGLTDDHFLADRMFEVCGRPLSLMNKRMNEYTDTTIKIRMT